jgi:hypothetical protein
MMVVCDSGASRQASGSLGIDSAAGHGDLADALAGGGKQFIDA